MTAEKKGLFITLEGPDGAGKSTQLRLLGAKLSIAGVNFIQTREPGGGEPDSVAEKIRHLLLAPGQHPLTPEAELLLFLAARAQHVAEVIRPALRRGQVVVCERFSDATFAYQVGGRGLPAALVTAANRFATGGLKPDLTLLLDLAPTQGLRRAYQAKVGHDRIESESAAFHRGVRQTYLRLARTEKRRMRVIPADRPLEWVTRRIWEEVSARLWPDRKKAGR
jgi:dTMP kinase